MICWAVMEKDMKDLNLQFEMVENQNNEEEFMYTITGTDLLVYMAVLNLLGSRLLHCLFEPFQNTIF